MSRALDGEVGSGSVRLPLLRRVSVVIRSLFGCGLAVAVGVASVHGAPVVAVIALVMSVALLVFGYRMVRVSLIFSGQELLVRNFFRTRRVAPVDIVEVHVGAMTDSPFRGSLWLSMRDGSVLPIDIVGRRLPFGARGRSKVEERHRLLQRWLAGQ